MAWLWDRKARSPCTGSVSWAQNFKCPSAGRLLPPSPGVFVRVKYNGASGLQTIDDVHTPFDVRKLSLGAQCKQLIPHINDVFLSSLPAHDFRVKIWGVDTLMGAAKILPRGECNRTTTLRPAKKNNYCWSIHRWQDSFLLRWRNFLCVFEMSRWVLWVGVSEPPVVAWMVRANQRETHCTALESGKSCEFQDVATRHGMPWWRMGMGGSAIGKVENRTGQVPLGLGEAGWHSV